MENQAIILGLSLSIPLFAFLFFPLITKEIFRDLRILRILHYVALAGLGMALYLRMDDHLNVYLRSGKTLLFPLFIVALTYAAVFAIITNNIEDLGADRISNPKRPLVTGTVDRASYLWAGVFCQGWALLLALMAQKELFFGVFAISAGYYLYSCKPFRLKRIPFVAKIIIGFNSLAVAVCGFVITGGRLSDFPLIWVFYILVPLSLAANFVDLKDTEGDRHTGIKTLPVLWGEDKARLFITGCTLFAYAMAGFLLHLTWVYPLNILMATCHIWFLYKQPYQEKPVFLIYVAALFGLDVFLFFSNSQF